MQAMLLDTLAPLSENPAPLRLAELPDPQPGPGQVVLQVSACGVCHTELDEIEGRLPPPVLPVVLGHQVVGTVVARGPGAHRHALGERLGVAWIFSACGQCPACRQGHENLCPHFQATGLHVNGGYAQYIGVSEDYTYPIPDILSDLQAAPMLCAGAIGYRSLRLADPKPDDALGLTGFGASAHLLLQLARARFPDMPVFVFARSHEEQKFALQLGAAWAGDIHDSPPTPLAAIIDTTPVWSPVVAALRALRPGGRLVINAIRKESVDQAALLGLDYPSHLWLEKEIKSVANVTRQDVIDFLTLAGKYDLHPEIQLFCLAEANRALLELKNRQVRGAKVLQITS